MSTKFYFWDMNSLVTCHLLSTHGPNLFECLIQLGALCFQGCTGVTLGSLAMALLFSEQFGMLMGRESEGFGVQDCFKLFGIGKSCK